VTPYDPDDVLRLLRRPVPGPDEMTAHWKRLASSPAPLAAWPADSRCELGEAILACAVHVFLGTPLRDRSLAELRRLLDTEKLERLVTLLGFVRSAQLWTEAHGDLEYEHDIAELLAAQPELRAWVERYRSVVDAELVWANENATLNQLLSERDELQEFHDELVAILEDSLNEIFVFDRDTLRFTQVNRRARENLGYVIEELRELTPCDLSTEFTRTSFLERLRPLSTGQAARLEFISEHRRKDGSTYPVLVHVVAAAAGQARSLVAIAVDITDRRRQEERLEEAEARARAILETAADAIVTIDESGRIQSANAATEQMFGHPVHSLIGKPVGLLAAPPHDEAHDGYVARYVRTGEARIMGTVRELEARRRDGSRFPVRLSIGEAIFDHSRLFTGIIHDISEQRKVESERDERNRRLRALFHQRRSLAGVCTPAGVVLEANHAALDYAGVTRADVVGRIIWEIPAWAGNPELRDRVRLGTQRAALGEFVRFEAEQPRADGSLGVFEFAISPVRDSGGRIDVLLVEGVDVTEERSLEEQLLQAQKMEVVGTLAGGIAHDFNNLLTSIRGSSEILLEALEPGGRLARSAGRIQRAADRATALTTRLLAFSRKQVIQTRTLDANDAVSEIADLLAETLPEDVEMVADLEDDPLHVRADASQLAQVLMNLAVNAADAMPHGGVLRLSTRREQLTQPRADELQVAPGDYVAMEVHDTGTGIPSETLPRIFEPFFTTKGEARGTGLGLSTSLGIVRGHGGRIAVASEVGEGTRFTVLLPEVASPTVESPAAALEADRPCSDGETVLVVEDDDIMRDLLSEILEDEGYTVLAAASPHEALARARSCEGRIDLVVTDVVMPRMSGIAVAEALRTRHPGIRVLYMSGYSDQVLAERGEVEEEVPFLHKPFGNDAFLGRVREILDVRRAASGSSD
jgi:PAS domain S-box-containing protein